MKGSEENRWRSIPIEVDSVRFLEDFINTAKREIIMIIMMLFPDVLS